MGASRPEEGDIEMVDEEADWRSRFLTSEELYQADLRARRSKKVESISDLCGDINRQMPLAYAGGVSGFWQHLGRDFFFAALDYHELKIKIREREPETLQDVCIAT